MTAEGIRSVEAIRSDEGGYESVKLVFGPHYYVRLKSRPDGRVTFHLGATHHGIRADASAVGGELERFINELREAHPDNLED